MKLIRFGAAGKKKKPGIYVEGQCYDVSAIVKDYDEEFFASGGLERVAEITANNELPNC